MTSYPIDLKRHEKDIHAVPLVQGGVHPSGERISFTNYYMELNGQPLAAGQGQRIASVLDFARLRQSLAGPDAGEDRVKLLACQRHT
jgi:hypothetical protein